MNSANPLGDVPRIHGELLKFGIEVSQTTVAKYMVRRVGTRSPTWRNFLRNEAIGIAAIDMFVAMSASFRLLYVMVILAHGRRKIVRFDVTQHSTAAWLSQNVIEAFPWNTAPRYLLRDRDGSYRPYFGNRVKAMGITEVITAPCSPWQNAYYVERVIGSIRLECLDQVVIFIERHSRRVLSSYVDYYHRTRTQSLTQKISPGPSPHPATPPSRSPCSEIRRVGQFYFGDLAHGWVNFQPALTPENYRSSRSRRWDGWGGRFDPRELRRCS